MNIGPNDVSGNDWKLDQWNIWKRWWQKANKQIPFNTHENYLAIGEKILFFSTIGRWYKKQ